jgi:hypothetical protein
MATVAVAESNGATPTSITSGASVQKMGKVIYEIKELALEILVEAKILLKELDANPKVLSALKKKFPETENEELLNALRKASLEYISDVRKISSEVEAFENNIVNNIEIDPKITPYMALVFNGDMYDSTGYAALRELRDELDGIAETISINEFVKHTVYALTNKK